MKISAQSTYKLTYDISKIKFRGSIDNLDDRGKQFTEKLIEHSKEIKYILYVNKAYSYFEVKQALKKEMNPLYKKSVQEWQSASQN